MSGSVSTGHLPRSLVAARTTIDWLPALPAVAYVVLVLVKLPALVRPLYWDSDAAGAFVFGSLLRGHGAVEIPRFGFWTSLWWLLATRDLSGHRQLWEGTAYVFALAAVAFVGWATWRVAGRWAGTAAAAAAVVVGPGALTSLLTVNFHTSTPFTAALLAAYLVVLAPSRSWLLAAGVGLVAGLNAASDPLLWIAGIAPFALAAGVLVLATKRRDVAGRAAFVLAVSVAVALATDAVMRSLGFHVIPVGLQVSPPADLPNDFVGLGKSIALVFGADHFFPGVYPSAPIRYAITLLAFAAVAAPLVAAVRLSLRRSEPTLRAFACYWAIAAVLLGLAAWLLTGTIGAGASGSLNYLLTLAPAAGVGVALLAARSSAGRIAVTFAIAAVAAVNIADIAHGRAEEPPGAERYGPQLVRLLERMGLRHGYGGYWDAESLTWKSGLRLLVAPVEPCDAQRQLLCKIPYFTIDSWYDVRPGPSFLIVDPDAGLPGKPPAALGRPSETKDVGPEITVYVYPYDLARQIRRRHHS
jgi:hypothetical protein